MRRVTPIGVRRTVGILATVVLVAVGCAGNGPNDAATTTSTPATSTPPVDTLAPPTVVTDAETTVRSTDNDFDPKHLQIRAGTTVRFLNIGHNKHNIIPNDVSAGDFSVTEEDFPTGSSYTATFDEPGTYPYYCSLHATPTAGSMRGVITVTQ